MKILLRSFQISLADHVFYSEFGTLFVEGAEERIRAKPILTAEFYLGLAAILAVDVVDFLLGFDYVHVLQVHPPQRDLVSAFRQIVELHCQVLGVLDFLFEAEGLLWFGGLFVFHFQCLAEPILPRSR